MILITVPYKDILLHCTTIPLQLHTQSTTSYSMPYFTSLSPVDFNIFLVAVEKKLAAFIIDNLYCALESSRILPGSDTVVTDNHKDTANTTLKNMEMWFKAYRYVL